MFSYTSTAATALSRAGIQCTVVSTERYNHARGALEALPAEELARFDGVVAVGGDGLFQETLNALLTLRCASLLGFVDGLFQETLITLLTLRCVPRFSHDEKPACRSIFHLRGSAHAETACTYCWQNLHTAGS